LFAVIGIICISVAAAFVAVQQAQEGAMVYNELERMLSMSVWMWWSMWAVEGVEEKI
jgi:hypothetical protein